MENEKVRKARQPKEIKQKAFDYYMMGLAAWEIEKLTGFNKRTLERYMMVERWKEKRQAAKETERQKIIKEYIKTTQ
jgi:transposase-like protein